MKTETTLVRQIYLVELKDTALHKAMVLLCAQRTCTRRRRPPAVTAYPGIPHTTKQLFPTVSNFTLYTVTDLESKPPALTDFPYSQRRLHAREKWRSNLCNSSHHSTLRPPHRENDPLRPPHTQNYKTSTTALNLRRRKRTTFAALTVGSTAEKRESRARRHQRPEWQRVSAR